MKLTITDTETTKRKKGEITFAQICEAFGLPGDTDMTMKMATGVFAIGPDTVISVSFTEQVKPRAKREAK